MSKNSERAHVITYQRVLVGDNLFVFVPCNVEGGAYSESDKYFINDQGIAYTSCDDYESLKDSRFQTYYFFPKPDKDLMEYYQTPFIDEAAGYYFDDLRNGIVVGYMDDKSMTVTVQYLSKEMITALNNPVSYQLYQGHGTVTLTKEQMVKLLNSRDISTIKKELGHFVAHSKTIEKMFKEQNVSKVDMTSDGGRIIGYTKQTQQATTAPASQAKAKEPANINDVERYIKERVVGQDDLVEDITSIVFWNLASYDPEAIIRPLLVGETGSGKSFYFKTLEKCLDVPVIVFDCNAITQSGYEGKSVNDVLVDAYYRCKKNKAVLERAVIYLDEIDKIAARGSYVSDVGAQNSLLKFVEGSEFVVDLDRTGTSKLVVDTSMMTICAGGAFQDIIEGKKKKLGFSIATPEELTVTRKDIEQYGIDKQLAARFEHIVNLNKVTKEMIMLQLTTSKSSQIIINQEAFFRLYGVNLRFSEGYYNLICDRAIEEKTGFRGIKNIVVGSLSKAKFALQRDPYQHYDLLITEETIQDPKKYVLE